ncbi:hypothetical protein [Lysinibacillus sp. 3P01SB]|uniref:hypothetical protein n=1 Tax=Lysinibacillus sp. 3P01SB TaxID=3132284 RepID=UPI0039A6E23C
MEKVTAKMAGAGTGMTVLVIWTLVVSEIDWYEVSETLSNRYLWLLFFGYGLLVALLVEGVVWKFRIKRHSIRPIGYMAAGFLLFYVFGINVFAVIAGIISAVFAFLFYMGEMAARHSRSYRIVFAFVLPALFLVIAWIDFSVKQRWEENRTEEGYEATFGYFHGEHRIPVELKKGESVYFTINFEPANDGGYGHSFEDANGQPAGMEELGRDSFGYRAEQNGVYYIVLWGDRFNGSIAIDWEFKKS